MQRGFILPIYFSASHSMMIEIIPSHGRIMNFFQALRQHPGHSLSLVITILSSHSYLFSSILFIYGA